MRIAQSINGKVNVGKTNVDKAVDDNYIIISYIELFEFKRFVKTKLKENKLDIYFKN